MKKNREDVNEETTLVELHNNGKIDDEDLIPLYENLSKLSDELSKQVSDRLSRFEITSDSLASIYSNEIKHTLQNSDEINISPQAKSTLDSSFDLPPSIVRNAAQSGGYASRNSGGTGVTVNDISKPISSFTSYFDKPTSTGNKATIHYGEKEVTNSGSKPAPPPPIPRIPEAGGISVGGSSTGSGINGIGGAIGNGLNAGAGSFSGSGINAGVDSNIGIGAGSKVGEITVEGAKTQSNTQSGTNEITKDKTEEDDDSFDLPGIPEAGNILKPLLDWRENLLAQFNLTQVSGNCPTVEFSLFGEAINIDSHCQVFDQVSGIISAFMSVVWAIYAFRVLFSA